MLVVFHLHTSNMHFQVCILLAIPFKENNMKIRRNYYNIASSMLAASAVCAVSVEKYKKLASTLRNTSEYPYNTVNS